MWALDGNDDLVHVDSVDNGAKCNCFCPSCKKPLLAKQGDINSWHFSHADAACKYGVETALHLKAKEILAEEGRLMIPGLRVGNNFHIKKILPDQEIKFDEVRVEENLISIVPDLIVCKSGKEMYIEIAVTHFVDDKKLGVIKEKGVSCLEINLSSFKKMDITEAALRDLLIDDVEYKKWIYHRKKESEELKLKQEIKEKEEIRSFYVRKRELEKIRSAYYRSNWPLDNYPMELGLSEATDIEIWPQTCRMIEGYKSRVECKILMRNKSKPSATGELWIRFDEHLECWKVYEMVKFGVHDHPIHHLKNLAEHVVNVMFFKRELIFEL